jgi:hypothetical protein
MEIILDALEFLHEHMVSCSKEELNYPYTIDYVDGLFQSLDCAKNGRRITNEYYN